MFRVYNFQQFTYWAKNYIETESFRYKEEKQLGIVLIPLGILNQSSRISLKIYMYKLTGKLQE